MLVSLRLGDGASTVQVALLQSMHGEQLALESTRRALRQLLRRHARLCHRLLCVIAFLFFLFFLNSFRFFCQNSAARRLSMASRYQSHGFDIFSLSLDLI